MLVYHESNMIVEYSKLIEKNRLYLESYLKYAIESIGKVPIENLLP